VAVQCESKASRSRPRVITRLTKSAPPFDKTFERVINESMRTLADAAEPTTPAGRKTARLTE